MTSEDRIQKLEWRVSALEKREQQYLEMIAQLKDRLNFAREEVKFYSDRISFLQDHALENMKLENTKGENNETITTR